MRFLSFLIAAGLAGWAAAALAQTPAPPAEKPAPAGIEVTADQSLEWYQDQQLYVARGNARAVDGNITVEADLLSAHQRETPKDAHAKSETAAAPSDIDKMIAEGHVRILNGQQRTTGDHAEYDLDLHRMTVTGDHLRTASGTNTVTAKQSLEYYEKTKLAVARGNAVSDEPGRHVEGDVLTAEFRDTPKGKNQISKMTAVGHVVVITNSDVARGKRAVYDAARNIAIITGDVHITRPDGTQLTGDVGEVDFTTNQSRLLNAGKGRVRALLPVARLNDNSRIRLFHHGERMKKTGKVIPFGGDEEKKAAPKPVGRDHGLIAEHLGKQYRRRPVVHDVSFRLQRGEVVGLLGPNGAGKTTCFYLVTGLVAPDTGSILIDGMDVTDFPMYRRARLGLGYLPQEASIFRGLSVEDNIRSVLEVIEPDYDTRETILNELLAEFGITHLRRAPSLALSGGERRRLEIARALASQPHFVLLDEPFAGIDPIALSDIRDLVVHLRDRGIGVLITDHNVRATLEIVDRAYIIHDGRVLMDGLPQEIVEHADVRRVYLGDEFRM